MDGAASLGLGWLRASPRLWSGGQGWGRLDVGPTFVQDPLEVRATRVHWQPAASAGAPSRKCSASSLQRRIRGQGRGGPACSGLRLSWAWGLLGQGLVGPGLPRAVRGLAEGAQLQAGPALRPAGPAPSRPGGPCTSLASGPERRGRGRPPGRPGGAEARPEREPERGGRGGRDGGRGPAKMANGLQFQASAGDVRTLAEPRLLLLLGQLHHLHLRALEPRPREVAALHHRGGAGRAGRQQARPAGQRSPGGAGPARRPRRPRPGRLCPQPARQPAPGAPGGLGLPARPGAACLPRARRLGLPSSSPARRPPALHPPAPQARRQSWQSPLGAKEVPFEGPDAAFRTSFRNPRGGDIRPFPRPLTGSQPCAFVAKQPPNWPFKSPVLNPTRVDMCQQTHTHAHLVRCGHVVTGIQGAREAAKAPS